MLEYTFAVHCWDPHHPLDQSYHSGPQVSGPQQHNQKFINSGHFWKQNI